MKKRYKFWGNRKAQTVRYNKDSRRMEITQTQDDHQMVIKVKKNEIDDLIINLLKLRGEVCK